ncbi:uncharacterized protein FIBRA_06956 [Fibroporia radiculosa]|uniref:Nuclear condensin complex subunit 3 C-terminal domain-containing protein n=1 Tax=Fibroporia radiculosa TaxID=599839 RepID=J4IBJ4_9APHY|nr:uncharacterized protein FIBRA_06956 [Fibroporia radiculosa]CCM04766.1 predicted protein [Fibroporia radiculosa]
MPARTIPPADLESLKSSVPKIFEQAQNTAANHQKNFIALYKLQADAATHTESVQNGRSVKLTGERAFEEIVLVMLSRVLPLKKGTTVADRVIKFVGGYTKFINEKASEEKQKEQIDEDEDTTASRFVSRVLKYLIAGCVAKDKTVRFRVVQCIAEMIAHLGEIDEDLYGSLRSSLMERVRDKEAVIRVQATIALSKLAGSEDISELDDDEMSIMGVLIDTLSFDPSSDVRRAALINMPLTQETFTPLLARSRDVDSTVRKLLYSAILEPHCVSDSEAGIGFTHPRALTIAQRELIIRNGLGDREDSVKAAAGKLISSWVDIVRTNGMKNEESEEEEGIRGDIVAFLKLFDLNEGKIGEDALLNQFWLALTLERAFLARVFVDHCIATKDNIRLESTLPVVTALAFRIQAAYNGLIKLAEQYEEDQLLRSGIEDDAEEERHARMEEQKIDTEFIVGELLKLAVNLDYADEIGRRKMFQLVRDMISHKILPESIIALCLDLLRILSPNERDFIRVVVEVVHELRDPSDPEDELREVNDGESEFGRTPATNRTNRMLPKPTTEMTPAEKEEADKTDLRCLSLCIGLLERVNGTFEENSTLEGILGELIIPSVKRKEMILRQKGLICLGLCCLIARRMALGSFQLFLSQVQTAPEVLKISVLQVVFDILMVHEGDFLGPGSTNGDRISEFLLHLLEKEESEKVQALLCIGISKLMLSGMIVDNRVLKSLVLVYISPETVGNHELRQCLSYFFPAYCYSSTQNQRRMQEIFIPLYEQWCATFPEWDDNQDPITPAQVGLMFVDWTDPQKAAAAVKGTQGHASAEDTIHMDLASDMAKALFNKEATKDDKKTLCQLFSKLYIPEELDDDKLRTLKLLTYSLRSRRPMRDAAAQNAIVKFDDLISKKFARQLEGFSEDEYRQLENMQDLFTFLDNIPPESDEEDVKPAKRATRKRRSGSIATASVASGATSDRDSDSPKGKASSKRGSRAKRRRISGSDEGSDDDDKSRQSRSKPPSHATPTRIAPRRTAAEKTNRAMAAAFTRRVDSEDEDEDGDEDGDEDEDAIERTPVPRSRPAAGRNSNATARNDRRHSETPSAGPPDSGPEDEDEEEEVDDILG